PERIRLRILQIELGTGRVLDGNPVEYSAYHGPLRVETGLGRAAEDRPVEAQRPRDTREAEVHHPVRAESIVEDSIAGDPRFDGVDGRLAAAEERAAGAIEVAADARAKEAQGAVGAEANREIARQLGHVGGDRAGHARAHLEALEMRGRKVDPVGNVAAYQRDRRVRLDVRQIERAGDSRSR